MTDEAVVVAGANQARRLLAEGRTVVVVVVDLAEAVTALLDERGPDAPGRVAAVVGDPADALALEAARLLAEELFAQGP